MSLVRAARGRVKRQPRVSPEASKTATVHSTRGQPGSAQAVSCRVTTASSGNARISRVQRLTAARCSGLTSGGGAPSGSGMKRCTRRAGLAAGEAQAVGGGVGGEIKFAAGDGDDGHDPAFAVEFVGTGGGEGGGVNRVGLDRLGDFGEFVFFEVLPLPAGLFGGQRSVGGGGLRGLERRDERNDVFVDPFQVGPGLRADRAGGVALRREVLAVAADKRFEGGEIGRAHV